MSEMTMERLRDWHRKVQHEWAAAEPHERARMVIEFPHGSAATFLDAHLAQPARAVETVRAWPKFVQDECLEVLRNMDTELGATGRKSARIERLINAIAGMPAQAVDVDSLVTVFKDAYYSGPVRSLSPERERIRRSLEAVFTRALSGEKVGPVGEYRLLTDQDTVQLGDQFLADDCTRWWTLTDNRNEPRWMIGKVYSRNFFVPARRALPASPAPDKEGKV